MKNHIQIPKGKLVGVNGPGSLYTSKEGISFIISAVDNWLDSENHIQEKDFRINNERLKKLLDVSYFREVPDFVSKKKNEDETNTEIYIPVHRFPYLHYCKYCSTLDVLDDGGDYEKEHYCSNCKDRRGMIQFPFVVACQNGHLTDFPYLEFLHGLGNEQSNCNVKIDRRGFTIFDWRLHCSCGKTKSLEGITGISENSESTPLQKEIPGYKCKCHKPWVGNEESGQCASNPQVILKNSINLYHPELVSVLMISGEEISTDYSFPELLQEEFDYLSGKMIEKNSKSLISNLSFESSNSIIKNVFSIERLEELVVQTGFTRVERSEDSHIGGHFNRENYNILFANDNQPDYLPAKTQYGEGIFIEFNESILSKWSTRTELKMEYEKIRNKTKEFYMLDNFDDINKILIHTLSHALIRTFSNHSGYNAASIREKIYALDDKYGLLIYVTDTDKDGTFGGLVALSKTKYFEKVFYESLNNLEWCSSDPVCTELGKLSGQGIFNSNGAACHNCSYVPSTSCSYRNCFLDRRLINHDSDLSITRIAEWITDMNDPMKKTVDIIKKMKFDYPTWNEVPEHLEPKKEEYRINKKPIPDYMAGEISIDKENYNFKFLWESIKEVELDSGEIIEGHTERIVKIGDWVLIQNVEEK